MSDDRGRDRRQAEDFLKKMETPNVVNRDNELLQPLGPIGHVDEVNGPGATEVPTFVPTRHELMQLAKFWTTAGLEVDFFMFVYAQSGSYEVRLGHFAARRVGRIAECLGDDMVDQACKEAEEEFAERVDNRAWQVFRRGTPQERTAFQNELQQVLHESPGALVRAGGVTAICVPASELQPDLDLVDFHGRTRRRREVDEE